MGPSFEIIRRHLRNSRSRRILVGAINDVSAIGALRGFEEAGRGDSCAVMGQNASPEGRAEIRKANTRLIGSVAFFPERYGPALVKVSLDILNKRPVPPAVFVDHKLVTQMTIDHFYSNDRLA
jgi:ribose transport system substrate-binding protein